MKLMFFIPTLGQGGGERVVSELSQHFPKHIESVLVVFEEKLAYPFEGRVISLRTPLSKKFFTRVFRFFVRLARFRAVAQNERPDRIITFGGIAATTALLLNAKPIVRVDTFASAAKKGFWGMLYKVAARTLFAKAEQVVAVSQAAAEDLIQNFGIPKEKLRVMYNPVDIAKIERLSQEHVEFEVCSKPVIITMGRLSKEKGYEYLVKAFSRVKEKIPDAQLVFLGEGEERPLLEGRKDVHILGWQDNPYKFLARARVFVLSSVWEGFPVALVEAMACGLPVVSTDCESGPREILTQESGILVPVKDENALATAIVQVLQDKTLARNLSKKAKQRAQDFDLKKIIQHWV